ELRLELRPVDRFARKLLQLLSKPLDDLKRLAVVADDLPQVVAESAERFGLSREVHRRGGELSLLGVELYRQAFGVQPLDLGMALRFLQLVKNLQLVQ